VTVVALSRHRAPEVRLPRLLSGLSPGAPASLSDHVRHYGPLPSGRRSVFARRERLIDVVEASGLTGRGGAGFPAGRKMRSVAARPGAAVVVANGAEGEPASRKDRLLLAMLPHLVLDGISVACHAVGARQAYLCVHEDEKDIQRILASAVAERRKAGTDAARVKIATIPARYVASEQSSIVRHLNGGPALPSFSPPRTHESGVNGRPTLVNNVETLAHLALIARHGDGWFRGAGLPSAPGTALVTVSGAVASPAVYEIESGTPVGDVIMLAGGPTERLQALLIGGYFGTWLRAEVAWQVPMSQPGLRAVGGALGAGIVIALPVTACPLVETARVSRYLAGESAGQCGPCVNGLPALAEVFADLAYCGGRGNALAEIAGLLPLVERRGACRHPDGAVQLVRSALRSFAADARWHDQHGPCAGVRRPPMLALPGDFEPEWS
jgi:NADH:ubiquinone oxidoreductase subunit F (NADH-binding)